MFPTRERKEVRGMSDLESFEGLVDALGAEADQLAVVLRSAFSSPPAMAPKERLEKFARNRRAATVLLGLRHNLEVLREAVEKGEEGRVRFVRAMRARGVISDN